MKGNMCFTKGLKDGIPVALGYLSVGFGFGILAASAGLSPLIAFLISATNLTSAGQVAGVGVIAAAGKFASLYAIVVWIICGVLSESLLASGAMKAPMLQSLPATFSWPQLFTALIGGGLALLITPVLRKALHK